MSRPIDAGSVERKQKRTNFTTKLMKRHGCHALGIVGALLAPPAYAALPDTLGHVDSVSEDSSGAITVQGWACYKGWSWSSTPVDLYVGSRADAGGTRLGTYGSDLPSEPAISATCQTSGRAHRFRITLNISMRQQYAGQRIYIYGHAYPTNGPNILLDGSGQYTVPAAPPARDTLTYIHTDRLGSSVILTDEKANIVAKTDYKAYGGPTQNEQKPEAPGYTGHYEDPLTGLTYMQARYYDADLGVFLSIDPMPTTPGNLFNFGRYGYANANPLSFVDPDGRVAMAAVWLDGYSVSAGGGGGGGFFFRPPSNNWWYDIERPNIGDYPGLIGGGGGGRPNKPADLEPTVVTAPAPPNVFPRWSSGTIMLGVGGSLILGGGPIGGVGVLANPGIGESCANFGFYGSGGLHVGVNVGGSVNVAYAPGNSSRVNGSAFEQYGGAGKLGGLIGFDLDDAMKNILRKGPLKSPVIYAMSVGLSPIPFAYSTGPTHTRSVTVNDVMRSLGHERCGE